MSAVARSLPDDARLPGLGELFPSSGMPTAVAVAAGLPPEAPASVEYVRYRPEKGCVILWRSGERLVSARVFAVGEGASFTRRASFRELARAVEKRFGRPAFQFLPDRRLLIQLFPLDARLAGLPFACSPAAVGRAVSRRLANARAVSYKPWKRCVLRYRGADGSLIGKVFRDDRGAAMPGRLGALARRLGDDGGVVQRPAAYVPHARLLLFDELAGTESGSLFRAARSDRDAFERLVSAAHAAAGGVGALQRVELDGLPVVTAPDLLAWLGKDIGALERVTPAAAFALSRALAALENELVELPPERLALAHGAFRHDQLLVRGDAVTFVDLDGLRLAGTAADAGNFLGYLDATRMRRPRLGDVVDACERAFADGLERRIDRAWLDWHRRAARVKCALRSVLALAPGWSELVVRLVADVARSRSALEAGR